LARFDGTCLYEHSDPRQGAHPDWGTLVFNYGRNEVRSFLLSSARFWQDMYHVDGLRVDAVASMLYLDYSRKAGEWIPNQYGGRENLEAVQFLKDMNTLLHGEFPGIITVAEESTAWGGVSRPVYTGGLGFSYKWDMGWMNDTLRDMRRDPVHRKFHQNELSFRMVYAFTENFILPLSHDEVVHGKGSLLGRMPGDGWQQFASLRLLLGYMWAHPGKKLLFMGGEFGQRREWAHDEALEWRVLEHEEHAGAMRWVGDLNRAYREHAALHALDFDPHGFAWVDCNDAQASVLSFLRRSDSGDTVLVVCNFTPVPRHNYVLGVPAGGRWREALNSDAAWYGGSGMGNLGAIEAAPVPAHGQSWSLVATLPPLAVLWLVPEVRHE
ncbi:MAG: 1,4-alpha-glucan branching enzyme, partial [Polyangiaceae bacterium]|nr:1,4-alpha-glucan branching enzyme [Polyangiaceae bacterium]